MTAKSDTEELLDLISDTTGIKRDRLTDDKSLFHDFGVAGMDGRDLIYAIGARFEIDTSSVCWENYFGEELPYNPFLHLWCLLRGRRLDEGIVRLQISDLKRMVDEKRWQEPSGERSALSRKRTSG